ncbi:MAG: ABC transporter ATP-binding protein [Cyclobacteriaceae bacterium]|nr:ABC transporter ATP-binding protein [Cyclobacteriaceae bacterium]
MKENISIEVSNLSKHYGKFKAVDEITFDVKKGEIFGFLGANGAGKSTAMKMLCGLLGPTSGEGTVAGFDIYKQSEQIKKNIGYMSQKFSLYNDLTVLENMIFYGGIYGLSRKYIKEKTTTLLKELGFDDKLGTMVSSLPLGWKQKISFTLAHIHNPAIVFLDEPTGGVDPVTRRDFWEMIYKAAEGGTTVFVTTHYMDEAEYCDRISMMVDGQIHGLGSPAELKKQFESTNMDEVFIKLARPNEKV